MATKPDIRAESGGSVAYLQPLTRAGLNWITDNLNTEPWQWIGGALAVEPRNVDDLAEAARADGLAVSA